MNQLQIVSVPIGNMDDITDRARTALMQADGIIAEDTRRTGQLLAKLGIKNPGMISYRDQNHDAAYQDIRQRLDAGEQLVLVTDAGTPLLSDPGYKLVRDMVQDGYDVTPLPGASALLAALVVSGLPLDSFMFLGFLPKKGEKRFAATDAARELEMTFVLYESPYRIEKMVAALQDRYGDSLLLSICKELTKVHETVLRGTATEILEQLRSQAVSQKGEWVIVGAYKR